MDPEVIQDIINNVPQIIGVALLIVTIIGIILGLTKKAIYFNDYNDLGVSAAVFATPFVVGLISLQFGLNPTMTLSISTILFLTLFCLTLYKTWKANEGMLLITIIVSISKLIMSFLYIFHLYMALTGKQRTARGKAWFILAVFTPILLGLVHTKEGSFRLSRTGRPYL